MGGGRWIRFLTDVPYLMSQRSAPRPGLEAGTFVLPSKPKMHLMAISSDGLLLYN